MTNKTKEKWKPNLIKNLRMAIFVSLVGVAMRFVPNDCIKTLIWLSKMPLEDL